jgi:hypothetical protein
MGHGRGMTVLSDNVGNPLLRKGGSQALRQTCLCLLRIPQKGHDAWDQSYPNGHPCGASSPSSLSSGGAVVLNVLAPPPRQPRPTCRRRGRGGPWPREDREDKEDAAAIRIHPSLRALKCRFSYRRYFKTGSRPSSGGQRRRRVQCSGNRFTTSRLTAKERRERERKIRTRP